MKKAIAILLIPIFFITTSFGVAMSSHFCQGVLKEVGFKVKACCKDVNKGGCCKTQSELVKVKDNFLKTSFDIHLDYFFLIKENTISFISDETVTTIYKPKGKWANAPPNKEPLYIVHSSLII